jgi:two-component system sensor histidine kinase KdpD
VSSRPNETLRPSPEALLKQARREGRGRLKVFLGAAPGVGKTYEMLSDSRALLRSGIDVVVGVVETHGRVETAALVEGFEVIPPKRLEYQGRPLDEMDIDAVLARKPRLVLVDELAHTNVPGSRHPKRYQDVEELLTAGIDVFTTLNIQHIESLNDVVASFTKVRVRETVPDGVIEDAEIEVVDIPPAELIERLKDGKVYIPGEATRALGHFFSKSNLSALRELALRRAAQAVDAQMLDDIRAQGLAGTWPGGERVLLAVSELPGADGLVRAAKRLADALKAPWVALHIETARDARFTEQERQRLAANLQLASRLGAAVVSVPAENVIDGIKDYALEARTTQIVVGKSARSRWFELRHGSVVDRLVRETPEIAVHVLPNEEVQQGVTAGKRPSGSNWGSPWGYCWSALFVAAVTGIGMSVVALGQLTNIGLLFMLPVMFAATRYGLRTGIVTGLISALAYNFFFMPPLYTFTIQDPQNVLTFIMLMVVAVLASQLGSRVQAQAELARRSASQNSALAGFARNLTGVTSRDELGQVLCQETSRLLGVESAVLAASSTGLIETARSAAASNLGTIEMAAARWAADHNQPAGRGSGTLTASDWMFQPLSAGGTVRAVLGLVRPDSSEIIRSDQHAMLISLIDQASLALERVELEEEMASVAKLKERDRLRDALLSSVSHDLRTPLTTILASLKELKRKGDGQSEIASIEREAMRLNRFVGNLLDMVRIEAGALNLAIDTIDLTEAIASAAHDLKTALTNHPLKLDVSPDFPLVRADAQLLHHCLINLIDNAAKYSPDGAPITISAERRADGVALKVIDEGSGLPPGEEGRVFDTFTRLAGSDRTGGTGLGLAIVRGFAEGMGLSASAANREDRQGAVFKLFFPEAAVVKERSDA